MGRRVTKDEVEEWVVLKKRDWTNKAIADKYHRDEGTVAKYLRELEGKRGEVPPEDSELEILKREKEKYQVLLELDKMREEQQRLPKRIEGLESEMEDLETALKAYGEDLERLRLRFNSTPIANLGKWKCRECGKSYPLIMILCGSCGKEIWHGTMPPEEKD